MLTWSDVFFFTSTLLLIILLVYIIFLTKIEESSFDDKKKSVKRAPRETAAHKEEKKESLLDIVNKIEANYEPEPIDLSEYERAQEESAIISYEELLSRTSTDIRYDDDYKSGFDDLRVDKIDTTNMSTTKEHVDLPKAIMMSYEHEEDFLKALKILQSNLVR